MRLENPSQSGRTTKTALCRGSPWNRMFQAAHSGQHWETLGTISECWGNSKYLWDLEARRSQPPWGNSFKGMLAVEVRLWVKNYFVFVFVFVLTRQTWACWNAEKPVKEGREGGGSLRGQDGPTRVGGNDSRAGRSGGKKFVFKHLAQREHSA